ncbi:hypothetical protein IYR97_23675 (plasmid) [Pseudomonas fulva]|jgi:hypothetical protein|uniref:Uncharacterized protein n=3 Tax=Pseudomonas TaxID=286 RepID=A0A1X1A5P0_PSEPU|nr:MULTISPECIES: hypothetical protein [Pseudomonas]MCT8164043.1 hypothetical protein [Pseudomonas sp. HD6422]MCT8182969.1 hypothetical protein [Pseudomonas sp. HD6421]MDH1930432.1 hypothetical protein [Pseudomonas sp. GD03696]MDM1711762.1 hypothetical protein [Pseudomonas sp. 165]ORL53063.1 hypothetical protein B7H18_03510 [Pseudomonas putida]
MGSTVSTAKLVGAFQGNDGQLCYALFEQTYSKNCHPHTPVWNAMQVGDLAATIKAIFSYGSSCEGGMLQGAGGRPITPEGYIASWLKELENPVRMHDRDIELKVSDTYQAPIANGDFERVKTVLNDLGRHDIVTSLEAGESVTVTLHKDHALLGAIYDGRNAGLWRVMPAYDVPVHGLRDATLGYKPQKAKGYQIDVPQVMKIHEADCSLLMPDEEGNWRCAGWAYSIVGEFVRTLWEAELREPGSYRSRVKAYRAAIDNAVSMPKDAKVIVDTTVKLLSYEQTSVDEAVQKFTHQAVGQELHLVVPEDRDQLYYLTRLPPSCAKWVITERSAQAHTNQNGDMATMTQLSLLG